MTSVDRDGNLLIFVSCSRSIFRLAKKKSQAVDQFLYEPCSLTLFQTTNFRLFQVFFQTTISNLTKKLESSQRGQKALWKKEKLLITCNVSFAHSVLKRLVLQTCINQDLFGKGLRRGHNAIKKVLTCIGLCSSHSQKCVENFSSP